MKKTKSSEYTLSLSVNEVKSIANVSTILEGLNQLFKSADNYKTKGTLSVIKDKLSTEKIFPINLLKRLYLNKIYREIMSKRLESYLK